MAGIGTIVNVMAIIAGGLCGLVTRRFLEERYQETIMKATGFAIIVMALGSTLSQMLVVKIAEAGDELTGSLDTQGTIMMILSLVLGALLGEWINLDRWFERFGAWLRDRSGNQEDRRFIDGFVSASLTVCVGAMAVIGSLEDGIRQDPQMLYAKAILDLIIIMIMTASLGKGCIFSAVSVGIFQGTITLLARGIAPVLTEEAVSNLSLVGNVLILCVGVNLIWPRTIRVANVLPAIVFGVVFALI
ncbi:MAG TPA: DUF554 domain-containing protein [Candidatus Dorea merdavium]|nr:DUF554 domain-containing protein [Candidatus Dorea merdavium]